MEPLSTYHKIKSLGLVAGMLLDPKYHSNNFRIERLLHLLLAECSGQRMPSTKDIRSWLNEYEPIRSQRLQEDPPEDTFISKVTSKWGDFRVYGGLWESHAFFLQRILNVVQTMPDRIAVTTLVKPIETLLKISEEIAQRNKARLNLISPSNDKAVVNPPTITELEHRSETLYFSDHDLAEIGCKLSDIQPFILPHQEHKRAQDHVHGLTPLLTQPFIQDGNRTLVVLPTAISWTIRLHVFEWLREHKMVEKFHENLVLEYIRLLTSLPTYRKHINVRSPLIPKKTHDAYFLEFDSWVDRCRPLHIVVIVDTLKGLNDKGINNAPENFEKQSTEVDQRIKAAYQRFLAWPGFREGLSLVVMAGYGRARFLGFNSPNNTWNVCGIGANDLETMAWTAGSNQKTIWKFVQHERQLEDMNIEFFNVNGILNLYGWWLECDHILVPSSVKVGAKELNAILVPTNCIGRVRRKAWTKVDCRSAQYIDGSFKQVRRKNLSPYFQEDHNSILYASFADVTQGKMVACALTKRRSWWLTISENTRIAPEMAFRNWDAMLNWLEKIAKVLDETIGNAKADPVLFELDMSQLKSYPHMSDFPAESRQGEIASYTLDGSKIKIRLHQSFLYFLHGTKNTSEAAVIRSFVCGFLEWVNVPYNDSVIENLLRQIIPNDAARYIHLFEAQNFREMMRVSIQSDYEVIDKADRNMLCLGIGHFSSYGERRISGKEQCNQYLNSLIDHLFKLLKIELKRFGRKEFVNKILLNIEGIAAERGQWNRTMKAVANLRKDKQSVFDGKAKHFNELTSADIACRILIEFAVSECPVEGEIELTDFDLSPLMAKAQVIFEMGNISDGISKGEIPPIVLVKPNGDVQTDQSFRTEIFHPLIRQHEDRSTTEAIKSYEVYFEEPKKYEHSKNLLDDQFLSAMKAEFNVEVEELRMFLHEIEDIGYERKELVYSIRQNDILEHAKVKNYLSEAALKAILESFSLQPRISWENAPEGYVGRDIYPWLYRRRLSLMMKPIIRIDESDNPEYLIAPGLCEMSVGYALNLYRGCEIEAERCRSVEMKQWIGDESLRRGHRFVMKAANAIRGLGYSVDTEVLLTAIFPKELLDEKDYGDFDLIVWKPDHDKVYLVECKKLLFAKTFRDITEQLQEFKGLTRNGRDDRLKKHLNRIQIAITGRSHLKKYCKLSSAIEIVPIVLFSNPVPVLYDQPRHDVKFMYYDQLSKFGFNTIS